MSKHRIRFICLATWFLSLATAFAAEQTVTGKIKSVDVAKNAIKVDDLELDVTRKTQITVDGKKAILDEIKTGHHAKVTYDDSLEAAISIVVEPSSTGSATEEVVTGKVKSVDAAKKSIKIDDLELDVIRKTTITIDGERATLDDMKKGQQAKVTYDTSLEVAISIVVGKEAEAPSDPSKMIVGRFDISWQDGNGKQGVAKYEFKSDHKFLKESQPLGTWKIKGKEIEITFTDAARGKARFTFSDEDSFEGKHTTQNGNVVKWTGERAK